MIYGVYRAFASFELLKMRIRGRYNSAKKCGYLVSIFLGDYRYGYDNLHPSRIIIGTDDDSLEEAERFAAVV